MPQKNTTGPSTTPFHLFQNDLHLTENFEPQPKLQRSRRLVADLCFRGGLLPIADVGTASYRPIFRSSLLSSQFIEAACCRLNLSEQIIALADLPFRFPRSDFNACAESCATRCLAAREFRLSRYKLNHIILLR